MALKTVFEATQDVVSGNEVVHAAGTLYDSLDDVPAGVPVRAQIAVVPDDPGPEPAPPQVPADAAAAAAEKQATAAPKAGRKT